MYVGEDQVMQLLKDGVPRSLAQIADATGLHMDSVRRIVEDLQPRGFVQVERSQTEQLQLTDESLRYVTEGPIAFPEYRVFQKALRNAPLSDLAADEKAVGLPWAKRRGWIQIEAGKLVSSKTNEEVLAAADPIFNALKRVRLTGALDDKPVLDEFYQRKWIVKKSVVEVRVQATEKPYVASSGTFDITAPAQDAPMGKGHPLTLLSDKISSIFVQMGFAEMSGDYIESSFWNFDALFQPQDHPARELADTFYVEGDAPLPDAPLVNRVKKAHETSWKYAWSEKEARRRVLRTHTTALSARTLAQLKDKAPRKFFAIGKVFRNEATDYSHLTEFYQVEGIVVWEKATFRDLLGLLQSFYRKLGFEKVRFRPSYFPYTEPSLEIEVYYEPKKKWLEIGGAGIFRPEVSIPLCGRYPVLAWGLSLERPLMILLDLDDIRALYRNDLDFLKNARLPL